LPLNDMNMLEQEFLELVEWNLMVDPEEYGFYLDSVIQHSAFFEQ